MAQLLNQLQCWLPICTPIPAQPPHFRSSSAKGLGNSRMAQLDTCMHIGNPKRSSWFLAPVWLKPAYGTSPPIPNSASEINKSFNQKNLCCVIRKSELIWIYTRDRFASLRFEVTVFGVCLDYFFLF